MTYYINCKFCGEREPRNKQHVIAKSLKGTYTFDIGENCHHNNLNPQMNRMLNSLNNGGTTPAFINIGSGTFGVVAGSVQCGTVPAQVLFIPPTSIETFVEINGKAKDFDKKQYQELNLYQDENNNFHVAGGSIGGWVNLVAVMTSGTTGSI